MKKRFVYILFFTLIFTQCENDRLVNPDLLIPDSDALSKMITHQIVAKDSIHLYSAENAYLAENYFSHIIFGHRDKFSKFTPTDTIVPTYKKLDNKYLIQFMFSIRAPKSCVIYDLEVRFYLNEHDFRSTMLPIELYKYPFTSSSIFVNLDNLSGIRDNSDLAFIQGFDLYQNDLYFHLSGPYGVYRHTLGKNDSELLVAYPGGDWITLYQNYLFIDISHYIIGRLNLDTREIDIDFIKDEDWDIRGMDFKNDTLYVLHVKSLTSGPFFLTTFDTNGNHISTEPFNYHGWSITIYENDLYTWTGADIVKYNIPTKVAEIIYTNLDLSIESIQILGYRFYYSDADKRIICYLPLSDFLSN